MMKKYNKPEIVALALETVDVIETSGAQLGADALAEQGITQNVTKIEKQITTMNNKWSW
jgi:hypothetical protein